MTTPELLQIVDHVISITVLVGGALAFLFRTFIQEWIASRFSKAVNKELEVQKHQLNRELEAYKGSVLRELEEFKANIDIRRSIALKMAEARLDALRVLYAAFERLSNEAMSTAAMNDRQRAVNAEELIDSIERYREAFRLSQIFIPVEIGVSSARVVADLIQVARGPQLNHDDPALTALTMRVVEIGNQLKGEIERPLRLI